MWRDQQREEALVQRLVLPLRGVQAVCMEGYAVSCQYPSVTVGYSIACLKDRICAEVFGSIPSQLAALPGFHVQTEEMYPKGMRGIGTSQRDGKKQDESTFLSRGSVCFTLCPLFTQVGREKLPLSPSTSSPAAGIFLAK